MSRPINHERNKIIYQLKSEGKSFRQIAELLKLDVAAVFRGFRKEQAKNVVELLKNELGGETQEEKKEVKRAEYYSTYNKNRLKRISLNDEEFYTFKFRRALAALKHRLGLSEINIVDILRMAKKQDYKCLKCGIYRNKNRSSFLSIDHIVPTSKGGENKLSNIQIICIGCNSRKKDKK